VAKQRFTHFTPRDKPKVAAKFVKDSKKKKVKKK